MRIEFECNHCDATLQVAIQRIGAEIVCPMCSTAIMVPRGRSAEEPDTISDDSDEQSADQRFDGRNHPPLVVSELPAEFRQVLEAITESREQEELYSLPKPRITSVLKHTTMLYNRHFFQSMFVSVWSMFGLLRSVLIATLFAAWSVRVIPGLDQAQQIWYGILFGCLAFSALNSTNRVRNILYFNALAGGKLDAKKLNPKISLRGHSTKVALGGSFVTLGIVVTQGALYFCLWQARVPMEWIIFALLVASIPAPMIYCLCWPLSRVIAHQEGTVFEAFRRTIQLNVRYPGLSASIVFFQFLAYVLLLNLPLVGAVMAASFCGILASVAFLAMEKEDLEISNRASGN